MINAAGCSGSRAIPVKLLFILHVREKYNDAGKALFEDTNVWVVLSEVFTNILQDPRLRSIYLIIDALDECIVNFNYRNELSIKTRLRVDNTQRLSLELNEEYVSLSKLGLIEDDSKLQETVRGQIYAKVNRTFLWAAFVLKELEPRKDPELCRLVLFIIIFVYCLFYLLEVGTFSDLPRQIFSNIDNVVKVVNKCGFFLTIQKNCMYFIHQSAKDFLFERAFNRIFPSRKADVVYTMFSRSLEVMSKTFRRDIYGLYVFRFPIENVKAPIPDSLAVAQYFCLYWVDHLLDCDRGHTTIDFIDSGSVYQFFKMSYMF
ncbi:hypothetical protein B0O99DRAFT_657358 [Bisporella sp. PMI_857]|nr:hypothetical protein B0O99DRAFT_657358 [Bisporella sp. PMI_857]